MLLHQLSTGRPDWWRILRALASSLGTTLFTSGLFSNDSVDQNCWTVSARDTLISWDVLKWSLCLWMGHYERQDGTIPTTIHPNWVNTIREPSIPLVGVRIPSCTSAKTKSIPISLSTKNELVTRSSGFSKRSRRRLMFGLSMFRLDNLISGAV